ncbi:hypothetical protein [Streptomyces sp. A5-4]|uniref:hypothetical protein n=1 Tax=Streptomyces sp. A5-4 TaxID=3384771 RepID=UPI003DA8D07F
MRTTTVWPPAARDHVGLVRGYEVVLGWALIVGGQSVSSASRAAQEMARDENLRLRTMCSAFDAISLPRAAGTDALLRLDRRDLSAPSLISADRVTLLVTAGTGTRLRDLPGVEVAFGSNAWLALPPSAGVRWDTVPWSTSSPDPLELPDGMMVRGSLADGLRLYGQSAAHHTSPPLSTPTLTNRSAAARTQATGARQARR